MFKLSNAQFVREQNGSELQFLRIIGQFDKIFFCILGHLLSEPEACLAMTGCFGSEDVELTINSKYAPESGMFKWNLDGTVENLKNPFKVVSVKRMNVFYCVI